jgi:ABC-type lipoprotein export system ATPase subunit
VALLHRAGSRVNTLSGGERQKAAIARALVTEPVFIFADEPTAQQDSENAARVMNLLSRCAGLDAVVIVATHEAKLQTLAEAPIHYRLDSGTLHPAAS